MSNLQNLFMGLILSLCLSACAHTKAQNTNSPTCEGRSEELQSLVAADQADRQGPMDKIDWGYVLPRDLAHRIRVAEIFAEGCIKDSKDYAAAALVYQHGEVPDHFFQTFIWGKKAVELGDSKQKWITAAGLDRYLVHTGQKQLFATQYAKDNNSPCWCLEPVETSFPEAKQIEWAKLSLKESFEQLHTVLNSGQKECSETKYCSHTLKATPAGSVPGFW